MVRLPAMNPAKQLTFLLVFFADGEKGATSVLGPQPIIGFYLPPPPGQAILLGLLDVTQVRLLLIQTAVIPLPSSQWDITWQKQGGVKYHFKSLWYGATWDWTQVSQTIGELLL